MNRIVEPTPLQEASIASAIILGLPRPIDSVDALVAISGQGESCRIIEAIQWWQKRKTRARHILIAGDNYHQKSIPEPVTISVLQRAPYNLTKLSGVEVDGHQENTKTQMDWVVKMVLEKDITSIGLFASLYHLTRCYLTLLRTLAKSNVQIPIIPWPIPVDPCRQSPETGSKMWQLIPGEIDRILRYQPKDVVPLPELLAYTTWLYQNMPA
jgi:hypothetical protein